jgi:single-strand DNA-binding protein
MNTGTFAGRLGRDGEIRTTPTGKSVLNFSLAVDTFAGEEKKTLWVACALWGERAEKVGGFLTKGKQVTVSGDVGIRQYTTQAGEARAELTCNVQRLTLQGGAQADGGEPAAKPAAKPAPAQAAADEFQDDIPFDRVAHGNH